MDTIVAAATPPGRSALAVLRLSGPEALAVARAVCPGPPTWRPRRATLRTLVAGGRPLDSALVTWMPGPRSYTGEDVVELSCHGNPVLVEAALSACVAAGARRARPGEFTRRAFLNGKLDLVQVEAVAAMIEARSAAGLAAARQGLAGGLSRQLAEVRERLVDLAAELELRLDHPEEDDPGRDEAGLLADLRQLAGWCREAAGGWAALRPRLEGARVALVGPVNAGKSSLFNRLVGERRALVSAEPGTTRDVVERTVLLDGAEVAFVDTAGVRPAAEAGELERAGLALAERWVREADLRLVVVSLVGLTPEAVEAAARDHRRARHLVVGTHLDQVEAPPAGLGLDAAVSNADGRGVEALRETLRERLFAAAPLPRDAAFSERQAELLSRVAHAVDAAAGALAGMAGPVVAAEELTRAVENLDRLTGRDAREAVLDRLFSRFCIGK